MIVFPILRSIPAFDVGIPVFRAICCLACVNPTARFHEKDIPGIFMTSFYYKAHWRIVPDVLWYNLRLFLEMTINFADPEDER